MYEILLTDSDEEKVQKEFNEEVLEGLKKKIAKKENEFEWINKKNKALRRFYNNFGRNETEFGEMAFTAMNKDFRALFVLHEEEEKFVFIHCVAKQGNYTGSKQHELISSCFNNLDELREMVEAKVVQ